MNKLIPFCVRAAVMASTCMALTCQAEVVVVASSKSPVGTLTKEQVSQIYLGKMKSYPTGGAAVTSILASGPARDEFLNNVLEKTESQARAVWSRLVFTGTGSAPKELKDAGETKQLVANNPNIIGVIDKASVDGSIKVVFAP